MAQQAGPKGGHTQASRTLLLHAQPRPVSTPLCKYGRATQVPRPTGGSRGLGHVHRGHLRGESEASPPKENGKYHLKNEQTVLCASCLPMVCADVRTGPRVARQLGRWRVVLVSEEGMSSVCLLYVVCSLQSRIASLSGERKRETTCCWEEMARNTQHAHSASFGALL